MRPRIFVLSEPEESTFRYASDGWYQAKLRGTPEAEALMVEATKAIEAATDIKDACKKLEEAGFEVSFDVPEWLKPGNFGSMSGGGPEEREENDGDLGG